MASPFPGMDPYLEERTLFPGFHHYLADELVGQLNARIGPKYFAEVNVRTVLEDVTPEADASIFPDVAIVKERRIAYATRATDITITPPSLQRASPVITQTKLRTVEVRLTESNELVTAIEILSPYNKRPHAGLEEYRRKRWKLLTAPVHLVEIDLLRGGERPGLELLEPPLDVEYVCIVNRYRDADVTRVSEIWLLALNDPLPVLPTPLLTPDPDVPLQMNAAIRSVYARAGYDWRIDYRQPVPLPELRPEMAAWVTELLANVKRDA
jgi:hypothetical protein